MSRTTPYATGSAARVLETCASRTPQLTPEDLHLLANTPGHGLERGAEAVDVIPLWASMDWAAQRWGTEDTFSTITLLEGVHRGCECPEPAGQENERAANPAPTANTSPAPAAQMLKRSM